MTQTYQGKSRYRAQLDVGNNRLLVAVPCLVGELTHPVHALLDTGAEWCVLPEALAELIQYDAVQEIRYSTRYGELTGQLVRARMAFSQDEGETVAVEATWFLSPDWPGPLVIGWRGCLERVKFGLDPTDESFYSGDLGQ